jgi:hypothetical protein
MRSLREEDVSGARALDTRELGRLVQKCEDGESGGIIVNETSRFARSLMHTAEAMERLAQVGARLVGATDGVDSGAPGRELILTIRAGIAREQWVRLRENFGDAARRAAKDAVHLGRTPPGYRRANGKRSGLVPDPETAAAREPLGPSRDGRDLHRLFRPILVCRDEGLGPGSLDLIEVRVVLNECRFDGAVYNDGDVDDVVRNEAANNLHAAEIAEPDMDAARILREV